jgi:hypothetical protein
MQDLVDEVAGDIGFIAHRSVQWGMPPSGGFDTSASGKLVIKRGLISDHPDNKSVYIRLWASFK